MKGLYLSIVLFSCFIVKAQHNVIMEALDAPDPVFTITGCNVSTNGWLGTGLPAGSADITATQEIAVNVTIPGAYAFTTGAVNGVTFSASGNFTSIGVQNVMLIGTGTPVNYTVGNGTFTYTVTNTTGTNAGSCNFTRKVYVPDQNYTGTIRNDGNHRFLYKVIIGPGNKEWLQTNLGAHYNQVGHPSFNPEAAATSIDDYLAFGSLFQIGRNSDGHELVNWTSATTATGLSSTSTSIPASNATPVNTGLFYISTNSTDQYGFKVLDDSQNKYVVGPGKPCPNGFTIPTGNFDSNTMPPPAGDYGPISNYNAGSMAWLNNPLKLVAPKIYRNAANGALVAYNRRLIRTSDLAIFPIATAVSPQYVIEGGDLIIPGVNHYGDRRVVATYVQTSPTYDHRGTLDGYPVRCVKP